MKQIKLKRMDETIRYTACTISSHWGRCFDRLTEEEKDYLDKQSVAIRYKKGEIICKQGSFVSQVMYVKRDLSRYILTAGIIHWF